MNKINQQLDAGKKCPWSCPSWRGCASLTCQNNCDHCYVCPDTTNFSCEEKHACCLKEYEAINQPPVCDDSLKTCQICLGYPGNAGQLNCRQKDKCCWQEYYSSDNASSDMCGPEHCDECHPEAHCDERFTCCMRTGSPSGGDRLQECEQVQASCEQALTGKGSA